MSSRTSGLPAQPGPLPGIGMLAPAALVEEAGATPSGRLAFSGTTDGAAFAPGAILLRTAAPPITRQRPNATPATRMKAMIFPTGVSRIFFPFAPAGNIPLPDA